MRFSAVIDDTKSFEDLIQAAACAATFSEDEELTLKILPDGIAFVCATGFHEGYFMEIQLLEREIFSAFKMEGISAEKNIIIMHVQRSHFIQMFNSRDEQVRIKLVKRNNQPKLIAEFKGPGLTKTIPVKMVKTNFLEDYMAPNINPPIVGLIVKQLETFHKMFQIYVDFKMNTPQMRLVGDGYLYLKGKNEDNLEIEALIEDLESVEDVEHHGDTENFHVKVQILNKYFGCIPENATRCEIRVSDANQILMSVKYSNANYVLYMRALRDEAFDDE